MEAMEAILGDCERIFGRSTRPFGIARVHLDDEGAPRDVTIEYLNAAMAATADCTPADLRGKNIYELWPDGDYTWLDYYYRAAWLGESVEFETVSVAYRMFQNVTISPICEGWCSYEVQDITSWLTYARTDEVGSSAGMIFFDARTQLLLFTDPARELCGLQVGYLGIREFAGALFAPDDARRLAAQADEFARGARESVLFEGRTRSGAWLRLSLAHAGSSERFSNGLIEDHTQLQAVELRSARRSEIIESLSSEYYALHIIDLAADGITPYLLRNDAAEYFANDITAFSSYSAWLDHYCREYVAEEDAAKVAALLERDSLAQRLTSEGGDFALVCKRRFGEGEQYIELRALSVPSAPGQALLAARNINAEVTRQISQNEALQSALALARHASEAKTTFLTNVSHDFRTPLNSIMGFSDLALDHLDDPARARDSIEKIRTSSEHLLDLINDVLDVGRIESGKAILSERPLDLATLVAEVEAGARVQADERGIRLEVTTRLGHPDVLGDQMRLNQILSNVIGNALKYTERGGLVSVTATEGAPVPGGATMFEFVVADTGCGMSEEFMGRMFMPFERAGDHAAEGTGLGMAITKNLVDLMGGTISVRSELGRGSEFTIALPLRPAARDDQNPAPAEGDAARALRFDGRRALVVDDDELSREMMACILEDRGFEVREAADGDEAVEAVSSSPEGFFDVIIMDMRMPRMTGDEAARAIRALPRGDVGELPIIAATADAFQEGHRRSREAGMTAHVTKPLNTPLLMGLLGDLLDPGRQG